jgi:hypothetical protein
VYGIQLVGGNRSPWLSLLSARRQASHLFLRYLVEGAERLGKEGQPASPD